MAEAMAASMSEPSAPAAASAAYDEDAAVAAAMAASLQTATLARTTSPSVELARLKSDEERERRRAAQLSAAADTADATATHAELRATTAEAQYLKIDAAVSLLSPQHRPLAFVPAPAPAPAPARDIRLDAILTRGVLSGRRCRG